MAIHVLLLKKSVSLLVVVVGCIIYVIASEWFLQVISQG